MIPAIEYIRYRRKLEKITKDDIKLNNMKNCVGVYDPVGIGEKE